jgi:hypothetical protein
MFDNSFGVSTEAEARRRISLVRISGLFVRCDLDPFRSRHEAAKFWNGPGSALAGSRFGVGVGSGWGRSGSGVGSEWVRSGSGVGPEWVQSRFGVCPS